jgi:hypothetical protein
MKACLLRCVALLGLASFCFGGEYRGRVGNLAASFSLDWHDDGTVSGTYSYPDRPGTTYRLVGVNPREGILMLEEFTGDRKTARCELTKRLTGDKIVWAGKMFNTDGRVFRMSFRRSREVAPETGAMEDEILIVDFGNPQVPGDLDERLQAARKEAEVLASGEGLEAHLFGELHYGWVAPGRLGYGENPDQEIPLWKEKGEMVWAAVRVLEDRAEIQYETPGGHRSILAGKRSGPGTLRLATEENDWEFRRMERGDATVWTGSTTRGPERSLLIYRPRDAIYYGRWVKMENLAPEACLWIDHSWGSRFYQRRFPYTQGREVKATVTRVVMEGEAVARVECRDEDGMIYEAVFDSNRKLERIPAVEGMPVYLRVEEERIRHLIGMWHVISWRGDVKTPVEFRMFPTEMADIDWGSLEPIKINEALYGGLPQRVLRPDFFGVMDWHCWVIWHVEEDFIAWPLPGDEGAGILELESIALEEPGAVLPWNPVAESIPFPTLQKRVGDYNFTTGFAGTLPGNR